MTDLTPRSWKSTKNLVPLPYRGVSYQPYTGEMTESAITAYFFGKEAYRRTHFVLLHDKASRHAIVAIESRIARRSFRRLFTSGAMALPERCVFVKDSGTDCANPSALAELAAKSGVDSDGALICEGMYDHINFIYRPDPYRD